MYVSEREEKVTIVGVRRVARSRAEDDSKGTQAMLSAQGVYCSFHL